MPPPKMDVELTQLFIDNEFVEAASGQTFPTTNPATEELICQVSEGDAQDVDRAVRAAADAFKIGSPWRTMDASARGRLMHKLADLMLRDKDYLARLETLDNGMPISAAMENVDGAVDCFRYSAGWADKLHGDTIPADGPFFVYSRKEPVGVVGQILPWNFPLAMLSWKWGPALAAGCTVVTKPSEFTPLTALYLAKLAREAGFPAGVINVVNGFGPTVGAAIARHEGIHKVAFTGSTRVGKLIAQAAGQSNLKRVSLELGGKSPLVVCDDVQDLDKAVDVCHFGAFENQGQNCSAGSRTFVQAGVYDEFVRKAVAKAKERNVGDPYDEDVEHGPQVNRRQFDHILSLIASGQSEGAKLECGGSRHGAIGYFVQPTVFSGVTDGMRLAREEIFGPVQSILKFDTLDELIERANDTEYGLSAGILTKDIDKAMRFSQAVQAGTVYINCYDQVTPQTPFGGYKMSGQGRELGPEGVKNYLETKTVTVQLEQKNS